MPEHYPAGTFVAYKSIADFERDTAERIVKATREVESRPRPRLGVLPPPGFGDPIPIWFRNDSTTDVPPYGIAAVVKTTYFGGTPLVVVEKPSTTFRQKHIVNGQVPVAPSDHGLGYGGSAIVLY
jgi:hypothetical protein